jgi:iron uptake system component EfeO
MITRRAYYAVGFIATGALLFAGCGNSANPPAGATQLSFKLTDAGCDPAQANAPAGPVTFDVTNDGAAGVTELEILDGDTILGERENLSDGLGGSFTLTLDAGTYTVYCPGGDSAERGTLTVTGSVE